MASSTEPESHTFDKIESHLTTDDPKELERFLDTHDVRDILPVLYRAVEKDFSRIMSYFMAPDDASNLMRKAIMWKSLRCIRILLDNPAVKVVRQHISWRVFDTIMQHPNGHLHEKNLFEDSFVRNLVETATRAEVEDFYTRYPEKLNHIDKVHIEGLYDSILSRRNTTAFTDAERLLLWEWTEELETRLEGAIQPKTEIYLTYVSKYGTPEIADRMRAHHYTGEIDYVARRRLARQSMSRGNLAMYNYWISDGFPKPVRITRSLPVFRDACDGGIAELIELYWIDEPNRIPELIRHGHHTIILNHWDPATLDEVTRTILMTIIGEAISCANTSVCIQSIHALGWWEWLDQSDSIAEFDRRCIQFGLLHFVRLTWCFSGLYRRIDSQKL